MKSLQKHVDLRIEPAASSAWELLLRELGLTDAQAERELASGSSNGARIRRWAKEHWRNRFIPESVTELLGLRPQLEACDVGLGIMEMHRRRKAVRHEVSQQVSELAS